MLKVRLLALLALGSLVGESLSMAFDRWTLERTVSPEAFFDESGAASLAPAGSPEEQTATLQLFLDIADFR